VTGFEVEIDGVTTTAIVQEKAQARATYEAAIAHGESAQLLEEKRSDVFQMTIGNLRPGQQCTISIT
jgi:Ca-activated chloride channel family protein